MLLMETGASEGMPSTIIVGYQTGRLASEEDAFTFAQNMQQRRISWGTELTMQFIDTFIKLGLLPEPDGDIFVKWDDLTEPSPRDKLELADKMSIIDERRYKTGRAPYFSDYDYSEASGFAGAESEEDFGGEEDI